jgi:hypothetical protein
LLAFDNKVEHEYKLLKKQLKLCKGLGQAPGEHQARLDGLLKHLKTKTGLDNVDEIKKRLDEIKMIREDHISHQTSIPDEHTEKCWFLRPLLSHLDHPAKIMALSHPTLGIIDLPQRVKLHISDEWNLPEGRFDLLRRYFSFKGMGKGSEGSRELERKFLRLVDISHKLPFNIKGITDLPLLHYNIERLWKQAVKSNEHVCVVSGICPLSIITDEITIESPDKSHYRPILGFEPLEITDEIGKEVNVRFPDRPIFGDYIELTRVFQLAGVLTEKLGEGAVSIKLWLPLHEYKLALTNETFLNYIEKGLMDTDQLNEGLNTLVERYKILVEAVRREQNYRGELSIVITDEHSVELQKADLSSILKKPLDDFIDREIPFIYGLYKGSPLRKLLFALLAFKHIQPLLENPSMNVLHIENSYEIWPSALASHWAADKTGELTSTYAWICTSSVPSPSLKYMRTLNAPNDHKIFLGGTNARFNEQLTRLQPKYYKLISSLIPNIKLNTIKNEAIRSDFLAKTTEFHNLFGNMKN